MNSRLFIEILNSFSSSYSSRASLRRVRAAGDEQYGDVEEEGVSREIICKRERVVMRARRVAEWNDHVLHEKFDANTSDNSRDNRVPGNRWNAREHKNEERSP
jgi:hypothetical protein